MPELSLLEIALDCAARGWHVFPCKPKTKIPATRNGFKDATLDAAQVRTWWTKTPDANVAIACGASNLAVLDMDEGPVQTVDDLAAWIETAGMPKTYTVRTGRRVDKTGGPAFGAQLYFKGAIPDVGLWKHAGGSGQVKSLGGYVMAPGSIHPDSGAAYEVIWDAPIAPTPDIVRSLKTGEREALKVVAGKKIADGAGRHHALTSVAGGLRAKGLGGDAIYEALIPINPAMCEVPVSDEDLRKIADSVSRLYPAGEVEPEVVIGGKLAEPVERPRPQFLSLEDFDNAKPPTFLIEGFLVKDAMCMLAGPVAQRKTLVAMNVVRALCTGEPLFGHFKVANRPSRVYYLCPEMGASSFCTRMRELGLRDYIGKSLFCLTLNQPPIELEDLEDVSDSVVVIDTMTRYVQGKESDSTDMRVFAARVMKINRRGATILLLHHSVKGSSGNLDGAVRGSSELAAFITSCWVTALEDVNQPFTTRSTMANVKQRDFVSEPFALAAVKDSCRLVYDGETGPKVTFEKRAEMTSKAELAAAALFEADPNITANAMRLALKESGNGKGSDWVAKTLMALRGTGVRLAK